MMARRNVMIGAVLVLALISCSSCLQRTLEYAFNEDCKELCRNGHVRLGHVKAIGPNDVLHYLWDFTESPTIFVAVTSLTAKLQVSWCDYVARKPNSLNFTEKPIYTFGVSIERFLEFEDYKDEGRLDKISNKNITEFKLKNFQWHHKNLTKHNNFVEFHTLADNYKDLNSNETRSGNVTFLMHGFSTLNHSRVMPCLLHSENATQIDIVIDHLETKKEFTKSRFAIELLIVSETSPNETLSIDKKRKLDDEFTPGIFEIMELSTPLVNEKSAYLQWRPVSYTNRDRDVIDSVNTVYYGVKNATVDNYFTKSNLLYMYYGEDMFNILVQRMNISLGSAGDPFYKETQYSTWTFLVGYGTPPEERFSGIVIMVISIGVGLPLLILVLTGIYICVRRRPQNSNNATDNR